MVIAFAGRRVDAPNASPARFPPGNVPAVRDRIRAVLAELMATALVASAACGADLIALDVARELGLRCAIVLPWAAGTFRETSVVDRGAEWGTVFDRVVESASDAGDLYTLGRSIDDDRALVATNDTILDTAQAFARARDPRDDVVAIVAWDGVSRGADDVTWASRGRPSSGVTCSGRVFDQPGIEHEGQGESDWPDSMYDASARLIADVCTRWSIPIDRAHIVGHREIYGRKTCPNHRVDFDRLIAMARSAAVTPDRFNLIAEAGTVRARTALNVRRGAPTTAAPAVRTAQPNESLAFVGWCSNGVSVNGNPHSYRDEDGNYFWSGATSRPVPGIADR